MKLKAVWMFVELVVWLGIVALLASAFVPLMSQFAAAAAHGDRHGYMGVLIVGLVSALTMWQSRQIAVALVGIVRKPLEVPPK